MKVPAALAVISIIAMIASVPATPVLAWGLGPHPDGWYQVTRGGWTYWMPPAVCTVGPFPAIYRKDNPFYKPLKWIQKNFGASHLGAIGIDDDGMKIYVANDVQAVVRHDTLIHEQAEARGCGDDPHDRKYTKRG